MKLKLLIYVSLLIIGFGVESSAQEDKSINPLEEFSRLIGGEWHMDGSYQVFEWGVGDKSMKSKSYFIVNETPMLVSEGSWFWHPGEQKIKGYFTAIQMPVELFDYTISFEEDKIVGELKSFTSTGAMAAYIETWEFTDDDHYTWTLFTSSPEGNKKVMGGVYERRNQ